MASALRSRRSGGHGTGSGRSIYYEPETDEEKEATEDDYGETENDDDTAQSRERSPCGKRRSARQLAGRKRSIYYEPDSDDDEVEALNAFTEQPELPSPKRRARRTKPVTRSRANDHRDRIARARRSRPEKSRVKRRLPVQLGKKYKERVKEAVAFVGPSDGRTPSWTSLPLEILRDIFVFASQPIHEQTTTASANVTWLIRAARTCRAFAVPALEAYYTSPSILTQAQPHYLLEQVQRDRNQAYIDYNVKVKRLGIDVRRLAYTATGRPLFDLSTLVAMLPQLQSLEVFHPVDDPPYRPFMKIQRWTYPSMLFNVLKESGQRLKSWRWNRDMLPPDLFPDLYTHMTRIHTGSTFEYLERLVVCDFNVLNSIEAPTSQEEPLLKTPDLASAIAALPRLKDLTFISCDLIMDDFLERLPQTLHRLHISNCLEVTADMIVIYLRLGGSQLRELIFNHNPALSLAYLPDLKTTCPRLEILKMDLTFYSEKVNSNDAWALYDELLKPDEIPSWPSTLQHLELKNLQKWDHRAAQNLFRSLIDSAEQLPALRKLMIEAHIDIPWRDRAGFRDYWSDQLRRVFLRKLTPPIAYLGSLRQFKLWKNGQSAGVSKHVSSTPNVSRKSTTHQGSPQVLIPALQAPSDIAVPSNTESRQVAASRQLRRSTRVVESQSATEPAESSSSETVSEEENIASEGPPLFIQGLCDVVDVRIDNQRPRENQYTEANFLDSEPSGDEDWYEGAELEHDGYAW